MEIPSTLQPGRRLFPFDRNEMGGKEINSIVEFIHKKNSATVKGKELKVFKLVISFPITLERGRKKKRRIDSKVLSIPCNRKSF